MISFDHFAQIELKVGRIIEVKDHPQADKLYLLKVDLGEKVVQVVAGIRQHYTAEDLLGKLIVVVANLEPRVLRGEESQGMLLAATSQQTGVISILTLQRDVEPGSIIK